MQSLTERLTRLYEDAPLEQIMQHIKDHAYRIPTKDAGRFWRFYHKANRGQDVTAQDYFMRNLEAIVMPGLALIDWDETNEMWGAVYQQRANEMATNYADF